MGKRLTTHSINITSSLSFLIKKGESEGKRRCRVIQGGAIAFIFMARKQSPQRDPLKKKKKKEEGGSKKGRR